MPVTPTVKEVQILHTVVVATEVEEDTNKVILEYDFFYTYSKSKSFKGYP